MDLKATTDSDLGDLLEVFRILAHRGNRVFVDLFCIVERETLTRLRTTKIEDYSDEHLSDAIEQLMFLVDQDRKAGIPDHYPALHFILMNLTTIISEFERRSQHQTIN